MDSAPDAPQLPNSDNSDGPSFETLTRLQQMMPALQQQAKERIEKRSNFVPKKGRKLCKICCGRWDFVFTREDVQMTAGICPTCEPLLKEGYVALICGEKYAFVKSPRLADMGGTIVPITEANMEKIEKEYLLEWKSKEAPNESNEIPPEDAAGNV